MTAMFGLDDPMNAENSVFAKDTHLGGPETSADCTFTEPLTPVCQCNFVSPRPLPTHRSRAAFCDVG